MKKFCFRLLSRTILLILTSSIDWQKATRSPATLLWRRPQPERWCRHLKTSLWRQPQPKRCYRSLKTSIRRLPQLERCYQRLKTSVWSRPQLERCCRRLKTSDGRWWTHSRTIGKRRTCCRKQDVKKPWQVEGFFIFYLFLT